ncbi:hypothetical protein CO174_02400 [Candidatus Uhrbacteria bacterium CG_4_9_14_3_um_filter_50_9]|uniref:Protein kinase domain-containing protein n=1 Tax=Candidatus Uhrbacteria bacterium CG_4_9_14_3_um_filter_50_9 TaxID=1975035 RepID=A0A2M7XCD1_9BACT|nr:MAG: hypothetical protein CO174_02400 [Candidatus Uhrbacteria bacterium CG_4_9_14_3_um_filter_50_9]
MSDSLTDASSLSIPDRLLHALVLGATRTLERPEEDTRLLLGALVGPEPTFADVGLIEVDDVERKAEQAEITGLPASRVTRLVQLLKAFGPRTLVCDSCGELGLKVNGHLYTFEVEEACPFCRRGCFEPILMTLRRLNWVTGELVDASLSEDTKSRPGFFIPLTDETIIRWCRGTVHPVLLEAREQTGVPLYGVLALMNQDAFDQPEVAEFFLQHPDLFMTPVLTGVASTLTEMILLFERADRLLDAHEVTNLPERRFLTDGTRRSGYIRRLVGDLTLFIACEIVRDPVKVVSLGRMDEAGETQHLLLVEGVGTDQEWVAAEQALVEQLRASSDDDYHLRRIPEPLKGAQGVFRIGSGFTWTLEEAVEQYASRSHALPLPVVGWVFSDLFQALIFAHKAKLVHASVRPEHILLDPKHSAVILIGWGAGGQIGSNGDLRTILDRQMACRVALYAMGADASSGQGGYMSFDGRDVREVYQLFFNHAGYEESHPVHQDDFELFQAFQRLMRTLAPGYRSTPLKMP